jgi:hypothetical protein
MITLSSNPTAMNTVTRELPPWTTAAGYPSLEQPDVHPDIDERLQQDEDHDPHRDHAPEHVL